MTPTSTQLGRRHWLTATLALTALWCNPLHAQGQAAFPQADRKSVV